MSIGYRVRNVAITPDFSNTEAPALNVAESQYRDIGSQWSLFDLAGNYNAGGFIDPAWAGGITQY